MIQGHIHVEKCDLGGGGMLSEFDGIAVVEAFKELVMGDGTMRPKEENVNKMQPEAELLVMRVEEILLKVDIGTCTNNLSENLFSIHW